MLGLALGDTLQYGMKVGNLSLGQYLLELKDSFLLV